jgi:hypothetical protein
MIEQVLEANLMTLLTERLQGQPVSVTGSWQAVSDGVVKAVEQNAGNVHCQSNTLENVENSTHIFAMDSTIIFSMPRSRDANAVTRNSVCAILLPFVRSFAGVCNKTIKEKLSGDNFNVVGISDTGSTNTFDSEAGLWIVTRSIKITLTTAE